MAFVRLLTSFLWVAVFVVALLFAIKNTDPVTLQFYFDQSWQAPLVFVVLASFAVGAALRGDRVPAAHRAPAAQHRRAAEGAAPARRGDRATGAGADAGPGRALPAVAARPPRRDPWNSKSGG